MMTQVHGVASRGKADLIFIHSANRKDYAMYNETTLRRKAKNIGFVIQKGYRRFNRRNGSIADYTTGYSIIDADTNICIAGDNDVYCNLLTLEDVEEFLADAYNDLELTF